MVDDFMVCVDRIIASACFEASSVNNNELGEPSSTTTGNVVSVKKTSDEEKTKEEEGKEGCCSKKLKEMVECRICQEEDDLLSLEAPCACNGTLKALEVGKFKFAHRKCIQRWCNKKGGITCEICKQVFSPNYSIPPTRGSPDVLAIDIRQAWSPNMDLCDSHLLMFAASQNQLLQSDYEDYVDANNGSLACLRTVALILLIILLIRQGLMLTRDYAMVQESSAFINVLLLQFAGFLLPCYVMARTWYIQSRRRRQFYVFPSGNPQKANEYASVKRNVDFYTLESRPGKSGLATRFDFCFV
ncbi:Zinc finger, RING-CH-type [Corchorus capsularis]|uniref:Zinc finger, RING-CH-type n=1 Tax=Corchorus capsularis TaxID=210143 RepID=A0A1R3JXS9_COCAP|nr:Zinc finger, RING-CH-type [Corchorus capsularis]